MSTAPDDSIQAVSSEDGPIGRRVEVRVAAERVGRAFDRAYRDLAKSARVNGFRAGRVPRGVLERMYGAAVAEEIEQTLIRETLGDAIEQAELEPVAAPEVDSRPPVPGEEFSYVARLEVKPEIVLPELEGLPARRPAAKAEDEDVERELEALRVRSAPLVEEPEGTTVETGHILSVDFVGRVDGEIFEGGTGRDVELEVGSGRFVEGFEEQLLGESAGGDREVTIVFPDDYVNEALAGKRAVFDVHVAAIKRREMAELDDEFAKDIGEFSSLEDLRGRVRSDLQASLDAQARSALRRSLLDALLERTDFQVPRGLVDRQLERRLERAARQLQASLEGDALRTELARLRKEWRGAAEAEVKDQLLVDAVARSRNIEVGEAEIAPRLESMAEEQGVDVESLRRALGEGVPEAVVAGNLRDEKALDLLAALASIEESEES